MASWNPALRPDSSPSYTALLAGAAQAAAADPASWNPAFRPDSSPLVDSTPSSAPAPTTRPPSYTPSTVVEPHSPPSYAPSPAAPSTDAAAPEHDVRAQVPLLRDEKKDSKIPAGAVVETGCGDGGDLEAGTVALVAEKGIVGQVRAGFGMLCYGVVLCLTLGMFGCYTYAA